MDKKHPSIEFIVNTDGIDDLDRGLTPEELRILKEMFDDLDEE